MNLRTILSLATTNIPAPIYVSRDTYGEPGEEKTSACLYVFGRYVAQLDTAPGNVRALRRAFGWSRWVEIESGPHHLAFRHMADNHMEDRVLISGAWAGDPVDRSYSWAPEAFRAQIGALLIRGWSAASVKRHLDEWRAQRDAEKANAAEVSPS